jgi:beta-glucosidase
MLPLELPRHMLTRRDRYFRDYITALAEAVTIDNVDCKGYMAWSLMDNL